MEQLVGFATTLVSQFQSPTLAFLIGGMMLGALGSKLAVPDPVYKFIVLVLLLKVGLGAGMSVREAKLAELAIPAAGAIGLGVLIVLTGSWILKRFNDISNADAFATAGLFGAVSASTLAAGMALLDDQGIAYEGFIGALYPFMDIAALVTAISLAKLAEARRISSVQISGDIAFAGGPSGMGKDPNGVFASIMADTLRSPAISALLLGLGIGVLAEPEGVYDSFYEPLFRGLLSILMLVMGLEAWARLSEMRKVAHAYLLFGLTAPLINGALGFGVGWIAHELTGFSGGGVVLLAVLASSSSDISGPPTMRATLPEANPSAYVGTSTGIGTPVAILSIPLWILLAGQFIGL